MSTTAFDLGTYFSYECDQPDESLTCPVCRIVLQQPVMCTHCRHLFCCSCVARLRVEQDRCAMCRHQRPLYVDAPIYVADRLQVVPNVQCRMCSVVVQASEARKHYQEQCARLVKPVMCGPVLTAPEFCLVQYSGKFVSSHGRIYDDTEQTLNLANQSEPLAPGLQWIAQQVLHRFLHERQDLLNALTSTLVDVEKYRPDDFGLRNEVVLQNKVNALMGELNVVIDQRSQLRTELLCAEERSAGFMLELNESQNQVMLMQEMHSDARHARSSSRKRRSEFDGQP